MIKNKRAFVVAGIVLVIVILLAASVYFLVSSKRRVGSYPLLDELEAYVTNPSITAELRSLVSQSTTALPDYIAYISVTDGADDAEVVHAHGGSPESAFAAAKTLAIKYLSDNQLTPKYVRADFVIDVIPTTPADINVNYVPQYLTYGFPYGLSFDKDFELSFLQPQVLFWDLITYDGTPGLYLGRINEYLAYYGEQIFDQLPDELYLFNTQGYFCDEMECFPLSHDLDTRVGLRVGAADPSVEHIKDLLTQNVWQVVAGQNEIGQFLYSNIPLTGEESMEYDVIRHASVVWMLINYYNHIDSNPNLIEPIQKGIDYLQMDRMIYQNETTAYIVDADDNQISIGNNAFTLIALTDYLVTFGDTLDDDIYWWYTDAVTALGNGIISALDSQEQVLAHYLYYNDSQAPDFSPKPLTTRNQIYDGESVVALLKAYPLIQNNDLIYAAKTILNQMINEFYDVKSSVWYTYALNYMLKYDRSQKFVDAVEVNARANVDIISSESFYPSTFELLNVAANSLNQLKNRTQQNHSLINKLDDLIQVLFKQALTDYFYPEYAMFFHKPSRIIDNFFERENYLRVRMDVQSHMQMALTQYLINKSYLDRRN